MVRVWKDEVDAVGKGLNKILARLPCDVRAVMESDEGFERDTFYFVLSSDEKVGARALMTWEAWVNAQTDDSDLTRQLNEICDDVKSERAGKYIYALTTTPELIKKPLRTPRRDIADEAALRESEAIKLPNSR